MIDPDAKKRYQYAQHLERASKAQRNSKGATVVLWIYAAAMLVAILSTAWGVWG